MIIEKALLKKYGAFERIYHKGECIFREGDYARYFFVITEGMVKLINTNTEGREFIQGFFKNGESFGEPPVFIGEPYPASAICLQECRILRLCRESLMHMLKENPELQMKLLHCMALRIYNKSVTAREIVNQNPEIRILGFLNTYKRQNCVPDGKMHIPFTRQEIANLTGLRVETVIRTLSRMKKSNKIEIVNRKVLY